MEGELKNEIDITDQIKADAQILWDYHTLYEEPQKSDFIIVTSHDIRCVDRGVELFDKGFAPIFIASGGHPYGEVLGIKSEWNHLSEAEVIKMRAIEAGVPESSIIIQDKSKNLGDVFEKSKIVFEKMGFNPKSGIFIYSPDQQRRAKASLLKQWPELKETYVTSLETTMNSYINDVITEKTLYKHMVGNLKKIKEYPALGFQVEQEIPPEVMEAYERLEKAGFGD